MAKVVTDSDIGTGLEIVAGKLKTNITKSDLGLNNVDNTSDVNKPISTATASAISTAVSGLVENQIVDGVTSKAPSQNAVFDALALKAPLDSPALTGNPTAPTATAGTNTTQVATTAFVTNGLSGKQNSLGFTPANDSNVVHKTLNEIIEGQKTFTDSVLVDFALLLKQPGLPAYNGISAVSGGLDFSTNTGSNFNFKMRPEVFTFGNAGKVANISNSNLTSERTYSLPNANGTIALASTLTENYLPKSTGPSTIGNSLIYDNGTNVGIGNTSPIAKLDIVGGDGNGIFYKGISAAQSFFGVGVNICQVGSITNSDFAILTNSNEKMRITSGGNVGINTINPEGILDVSSTTTGSLPFPRMTSAQRGLINSPAIGTHVYQTDGIEGVYVKKSTGWQFAY
jgi:hypothetical protein